MQKLTFICAILLTAGIVYAADTTTEKCANGAGTVITGAVSGHKYCKSNNTMNWWNAYAWCDGMGRRLFDRPDCACGDITADCAKGKCPETVGVYATDVWCWMAGAPSPTHGWNVKLLKGEFVHGYAHDYAYHAALCY